MHHEPVIKILYGIKSRIENQAENQEPVRLNLAD
jgi:hypothetical protein